MRRESPVIDGFGKQGSEPRQYWLLWDKSTVVDTAQPGWRGLNSSSSQVNKPVESRRKAH